MFCDIQDVHFSPKAHSPPRGIFLLNEILDCIRLACPQCNEHQWFTLPEWAKVLSEKLEDILERKEVKFFPKYHTSLHQNNAILARVGLSTLGGERFPSGQRVRKGLVL